MSEAKHTPGPWMAAAAPSSVVGWPVVGSLGRAIASVHCAMQKPPHVSEAEWQAYRDECEADASLIAAAPDLLEALRVLLELHVAHHNSIEHAAARKAIAKAGGQP